MKKFVIPLVIILIILVAIIIYILIRRNGSQIFSNAYLVWSTPVPGKNAPI